MRLPPDNGPSRKDRHALFNNLMRQCDTRDKRLGALRQWRTSYLTGSTLGMRARYNKLREHVQESAADLYAPESVRFSVALPKRYGDKFLPQQDIARDDFADQWSESGADLAFSQMVEWAHVYPTTLGKVIANRGRAELLYVDPCDVGVAQDEVTDWREQEVLCHWFTMSIPAYARMIRAAIPDKARADALIRTGIEHAESVNGRIGDALPAGVQMILTATSPTMQGVVPGLPDITQPLDPQTIEPVVKLAELWVFDDEAHEVIDDRGKTSYIGDYRVVRIHEPTLDVLYEIVNPNTSVKESPIMPAGHAFHALALEPIPFYIWGQSPLDALLALQEWHEDWLGQLRQLFDLNARPPYVAIGVQGLTDEKMKILRSPGGNLPLPYQNASIESLAPTMPPDGVDWLAQISRMFARLGGRPLQMSGMADASSRTGDQDLIRAMLGSGPTLTKAMRVEAALAGIATAMFRIQRRLDPEPMRLPATKDAPEGERFYLSQLPQQATVKVDAHSHSPVFQTQLLPKIQFAAQVGWIGPKGGLRLLNLPMSDELQAEARGLAEVMAERGHMIQDNKNKETQAKVVTAAAKMRQAIE